MTENPTTVELSRIVINERSEDQIVYLRELDGERTFSLVVGMFEADAIYRVVQEMRMSRPLTHDLLVGVLDGTDSELERVLIDSVNDGTFHAKLFIRRDDKQLRIDARPSDAMALALRTASPIYVEREVLDKSESPEDGDSDQTDRLRKWLESVDPEELGKYEM